MRIVVVARIGPPPDRLQPFDDSQNVAYIQLCGLRPLRFAISVPVTGGVSATGLQEAEQPHFPFYAF